MHCCLKSIKDLNFNIPPIQRGLVWEPGQVINLWDSLSKGYPIGSFMCYGDETQPNLLDGQQRYNAICLGLGGGMSRQNQSASEGEARMDEPPQAQLWVCRHPQQLERPMFMVCSSCHPWGFRVDAQGNVLPLEHSEQARANACFLAPLRPEGWQPSLDDLFCKAPLEAGYPWYPREAAAYRWYVPLPLLLRHTSVEGVLRAWYGAEKPMYGHSLSWEEAQKMPSGEQERTLAGEIAAMLQSDWLAIIRRTEVPVLWWNPNGKNLQELFQRINKGGSVIRTSDLNYSSLCACCADASLVGESAIDLKDVQRQLSENFLPPETLAELAARMVKLEESEAGNQTANLLNTAVDVRDIRKWFTGGSAGAAVSGRRFLELYRGAAGEGAGAFPRVVERYKKCFFRAEKDAEPLPATLFLFQNELWLFVCLWTMMRFPHAFAPIEQLPADEHLRIVSASPSVLPQLGDSSNHMGEMAGKNYFPLFCLLPQMLVGSDRPAAVEHFARGFYEGLRDMELNTEASVRQECSLLRLMAVGCANAALQHESCMYPYPWSDAVKTQDDWFDMLRRSPEEPREKSWQAIFSKYVYGSRTPNLFLHYYQRFYVNRMLRQSNFNAGMRAHWEKAANRPWDVDHIIPDSWWSKQDGRRHTMGNLQLLDFRANRQKQNRAVNSRPENMDAGLHQAFSEQCLRVWNGRAGADSRGDRMSIRRLGAHVQEETMAQFQEIQRKEQDYDGGVSQRADYIMETLLSELHVFDLLKEIAGLAARGMEAYRGLRLEASVRRYEFLSELARKLGTEAEWATCEYYWATRHHHALNSVPARKGGEEMNFYASLCNQLQVGLRVSPQKDRRTPPLYLLCANVFQNAGDCWCECGLRRGLGVSLADWRARLDELSKNGEAQGPYNDWWQLSAYGQNFGATTLSTTTPGEVWMALMEWKKHVES